MYDPLDAEPAAEATQMAPTVTAPPPSPAKRDSAVVDGYAWSEEPDEPIEEPAPYPADDYYDDPFAAAALPARAVDRRRPRHRLPRLALGLGVALAVTGVVGVTYSLGHESPDPAPPQPEQDGVVTSTLPATTTTHPPAPTTTRPVAPPPPTTTAPPPEPTTTEAPRTTAAPPRSTAPSTTVAPSTTAPPPAAESPSPTEPAPAETPSPTVSMTTEYLRIPLVPVPIPITVPQP